MTKLIVNADDFGMSEGVTLGILKAHSEGIVRSTTMMVGMPFAAQAAQMAKDYPHLGVGIHFNMTAGKPVSNPEDIPSLLESDGTFHSYPWHLKNKEKSLDEDELNYDEVYIEYQAQLNRFVELTGKLPDHFDAHHGTGDCIRLHQQIQKIVDQYDLPVRCNFDYIKSNYERPFFSGYFHKENASVEYFTKDLDHILDKDIFEIACHPAFVDEYLYTHSTYSIPRTNELAILCNEEVKEWISNNHIELINFQDLKKIK